MRWREILGKVKKFLPKLFVGVTGPKMDTYDFLDEGKKRKNEEDRSKKKKIA
jgi:hypothetical protein